MRFPAVNVSIKYWDKNMDYLIYVLYDNFIYTTDNEYYEKNLFNMEFVDSNGDIFKLSDRILPNKLRRFFGFVPNVCKVELVFEPTKKAMTIEQVRQHILNQLNVLEDDENKFIWIKNVQKARTFEEVIFGQQSLH